MQAVILAAGKSTRTYPLTLTRPKPLLKVANKEIILHSLDCLKGFASEAIIVVGYKKEQIIRFLGSKYGRIRIKYVYQKKQLGTGHALMLAQKHIKGRFIMMAGDDIYSKSDAKKLAKHEYAILTAKTANPSNFGVIVHKKGVLCDFVEKPKKFISDTINTSMYCFGLKIFDLLKKIKKSKRGEYELPDAIRMLSSKRKVMCIPSSRWIPIGYPWDVIKADGILRKGKNKIGSGSKVHGKIINSSIGKNCIIYGNVSGSVVFDNSIIEKNSSVSDSVIGNDVVFLGKIKSSDAKYNAKGNASSYGKFGCAIGDGSVIENCSIKPGVKISPNSILKNRTVSEDV